MYFTYQEAKDLLEFFGEDSETEITVIEIMEADPNHSGPGLYAFYSDYPDEGTTLLGNGRPTHNPSLKTDKLQSCRCGACGCYSSLETVCSECNAPLAP